MSIVNRLHAATKHACDPGPAPGESIQASGESSAVSRRMPSDPERPFDARKTRGDSIGANARARLQDLPRSVWDVDWSAM